jgi:excisionase family DNA binding protein
MPSITQIQAEFHAGYETVKEAFEALSAKGLITSAGKPGHYVGNGRPPQTPRPRSISYLSPSGAIPARAGEVRSTLLTQRYLTVQEFASMLRVAQMTVYRLIENGEIEGVIRVGKSYRIPEDSAVAYIRNCDIQAAQPRTEGMDTE